jgi:hypothetical protein
MSVWAAFRDGGGRVARAPAIVVGVWIINLLAAIPLTLLLHDAIAAHLGPSLRAEQVARGFDLDWWEEFEMRADVLGRSFGPSVIGFAAPLSNVSALADAELPGRPILIAVAGWLLLWTFLSGGILDRYARNRATRGAGFFGACGDWFGRMLRLDLFAGIAYLILFLWIHPLLFDRLYGWLTHGLAVERTAFLYRLALYLVFGVLAMAIHVLADVTRMRAVVEDRRSIIGAAVAAWRFIRQRPLQVIGVYACAGVALLLWLTIYAIIAPGATIQGGWIWLALFAGQIYIVGRLWLKLQTQAALIALYQEDFGRRFFAPHPITAIPVWPDAPAADADTPSPTTLAR